MIPLYQSSIHLYIPRKIEENIEGLTSNKVSVRKYFRDRQNIPAADLTTLALGDCRKKKILFLFQQSQQQPNVISTLT